MKLTFFGATDTVTGSRFLIEHNNKSVLIDCGLFQGPRPIRERNWHTFPVSPHKIDAIVLTHAHIDHSGYIPALVKQGFQGKVFCTRATRELCEILLPDSGRLQEEEANYRNRHGATKYHPALPVYTEDDAHRALKSFKVQKTGKAFAPVAGLEASFSRVGHILGAAYIHLSDGHRSVTFSGDVGRLDDPIMNPPEPLRPTDYLVLESTYGDRRHETEDPALVLEEVVCKTAEGGGVVLIPSFAVGRAQLIQHLLAQAMDAGRIPDLPIYLDSPMAINATELFCAFPAEHSLGTEDCRTLDDRVTYTRSVKESKAIFADHGPKIIISASGMATGGRVLHHLRHYLPDESNTILIVGFQAANTRGAGLERGDAEVRIFGEDVPVKAQVISIEGLSAHADYEELTTWISALKGPPRKLFLVHGEPESRIAFGKHLEQTLGWNIELPEFGRSFVLD